AHSRACQLAGLHKAACAPMIGPRSPRTPADTFLWLAPGDLLWQRSAGDCSLPVQREIRHVVKQ
ncbi:MAG: hypothetical protein ACREPS_08115, partial [Rhodanobacteraceae bacterium]